MEAPRNLSDLQRWMRWALTRKLTRTDEPYPRRRESLVSDRIMDRAGRLAIYANAYFYRLRDVLAVTFPRVRETVGAETFEALTAGYLGRHESTRFTVEDLGHAFAGYLASEHGSLGPPYLAELAALEWAMQEAFYADDVAPLDAARLAAARPEAWEGATFRIDPAVRLVSCRWRVDSDRLPGPAHYLVFRHENAVYVSDIGETASRILGAMREGRTLGELCACAGGEDVETVQRVFAERFPQWISQSVIREVRFPA